MNNCFFTLLAVLAWLGYAHGAYFSANKPIRQRDPLNRKQFFLNFQNVITNTDGSFMKDYGAFSPPYPGFYYFHVCSPGSGRRAKLAMFKYTAEEGPQKILTIKPRNTGKCFSTILYLKKGEFVYNVILGGKIPNNSESFTFTGHLLPDLPISPKIHNRGQDSETAFPFADAIPQDVQGDSGENPGRRTERPPFTFNRRRG